MFLDKIRQDLDRGVKEKDRDKLRTLRFLLSNIQNLAIEKYPPEKGGLPAGGLTDEDVISVIQKLVKTHKESIEAFKSGGREDLVKQEEAELALLQKYLPESLSEEEIKKITEEVIRQLTEQGLTDFGKIMGQVMAKVKGRADGATVARIVKEVLSGPHPNL